MLRRCLVTAGVLLLALPATAQDIPGEFETKLAINSIGIGLQQVARGWETFTTACKGAQQAVEQAQAQARYWQEACRSTPQCGGGGGDAKQ